MHHINAGVTTKISDQFFVDDQGQPHELLKDVLTGALDFTVHPHYVRVNFWKTQTYPYHIEQIGIATSKDSAKFSNVIAHIFTLRVWLFFIISGLLCIVILKYALNQSLSIGALEFVRMLTSTSTLNEPRKLHGKILLITLIIACFAMGTLFTSCFSAMVTVSDQGAVIDTPEDLIKSNLSIYGTTGVQDIIPQKEIRERYREMISFKQCSDRILQGDRIACIRELGMMRFYLYENATVHISRNALVSRAHAHVLSQDSPLRRKFTWILMKMTEGGITHLFYDHDQMHVLKNLDSFDDMDVSDIEEWSTTFFLLIGGWAFGILVLLFEIGVYNLRKWEIKIPLIIRL